jgi:hypothetical protein
MKMKKKWMMIGVTFGLSLPVLFAFTNLTPILVNVPPPIMLKPPVRMPAPPPPNTGLLKQEAAKMATFAKQARWYADQARVSNVPADQQAYLKAAANAAAQVRTIKNRLSSLGLVKSRRWVGCKVVNEPCYKSNMSQVREVLEIPTADKNACLNYAVSEQRACKSMSVATFYDNTYGNARKAVGTTCILRVSKCAAHADWVGNFRSFDKAANESRSTCMAEAKGYFRDCRESDPDSVVACYYENGAWKESRDGYGATY